MKERKKVIFWGTGHIAREFYRAHDKLQQFFYIVGFTDNDSEKWGSVFEGFSVIKPGLLLEYSFDYIVVLSSVYYDEIKRGIIEKYSICEEKILSVDSAQQLYLKYVYGVPENGHQEFVFQNVLADMSFSEKVFSNTRFLMNLVLEYMYVQEKYSPYIRQVSKEFQRQNTYQAVKKEETNIWVCWLQGMENAPEIVKKCIASIQRNVKGIFHLITYENYADYVEIEDDIVEKHRKGIIKHAHFSDIIRVALLFQYGGIWIDSTVYMMDEGLPEYIYEFPLFMYRKEATLDEGYNDPRMFVNWFLRAEKGNQLIGTIYKALVYYWQREDQCNYCIFHVITRLSWDYYEDERKDNLVVYSTNSRLLRKVLNKKFNEALWKIIKSVAPMQKLTYKKDFLLGTNTFYQYILRRNID